MKSLSIIVFLATAIMGSSLIFASAENKYPSQWFDEIDRSTAKWWEILPQDAKPGEVILSKRNELGLLSNFASTPVEIDGVRYKSLEGFWQMMKYPEGNNDLRNSSEVEWPHSRQEVAQMTAFEAKKAGDIGSKNMKKLGINWVSYQGKQMTYRTPDRGEHFKLVYRAMWEKLRQNPSVYKVLMKTGELNLKPDHKQGDNPPPAWQYHKIYMEMRAKLQNDPKAIKKSL